MNTISPGDRCHVPSEFLESENGRCGGVNRLKTASAAHFTSQIYFSTILRFYQHLQQSLLVTGRSAITFERINPSKSKTMNKAELIDAISSEAKITKADASRALEAFMNATTKSLKKGERVALVGFGTFTVSKRAARNGRNPQTGKPIKIAARKVAKFKAGLELSTKIK